VLFSTFPGTRTPSEESRRFPGTPIPIIRGPDEAVGGGERREAPIDPHQEIRAARSEVREWKARDRSLDHETPHVTSIPISDPDEAKEGGKRREAPRDHMRDMLAARSEVREWRARDRSLGYETPHLTSTPLGFGWLGDEMPRPYAFLDPLPNPSHGKRPARELAPSSSQHAAPGPGVGFLRDPRATDRRAQRERLARAAEARRAGGDGGATGVGPPVLREDSSVREVVDVTEENEPGPGDSPRAGPSGHPKKRGRAPWDAPGRLQGESDDSYEAEEEEALSLLYTDVKPRGMAPRKGGSSGGSGEKRSRQLLIKEEGGASASGGRRDVIKEEEVGPLDQKLVT
jgi:hypothetical protein